MSLEKESGQKEHSEQAVKEMMADFAVFKAREDVLSLKKAMADKIALIREAHVKRVKEENKVRLQKKLRPLMIGKDFSIDESDDIERIQIEAAPAYQNLIKEENERRIEAGKVPFPEKKYTPEIILNSPESYLKDLSETEFFSEEEALTYLPQFDVFRAQEEPFHLTPTEVDHLLKNEEWLNEAIQACNNQLEDIDKKIKKVIRTNDESRDIPLKKLEERSSVDFQNKDEVDQLERRGKVLEKKIFFNKCLATKKLIQEIDPDYFLPSPSLKKS